MIFADGKPKPALLRHQGKWPTQDNLAKQDKAVGGNCDLDSSLLPKMLEQAERIRADGNYPAALRQFRAVLACDPHNARARSGLDLTELGMQHQELISGHTGWNRAPKPTRSPDFSTTKIIPQFYIPPRAPVLFKPDFRPISPR